MVHIKETCALVLTNSPSSLLTPFDASGLLVSLWQCVLNDTTYTTLQTNASKKWTKVYKEHLPCVCVSNILKIKFSLTSKIAFVYF